MPSSLGDRLIGVVRQVGDILQFTKFPTSSSSTRLGYLNSAHGFVPIYTWLMYCRTVFRGVKPYNPFNPYH